VKKGEITMLAKRVHRLSGTALVVAVLLLILAMNTGRAAATTGKSGAVAAVEVRLWIHLQGALTGPQFAAVAKGRVTLRVVKFTQSGGVATRTGAISDEGRFVDRFEGNHPPDDPHVRTLVGAKGTIRFRVDEIGVWKIVRGTKAYAGLRGRGKDCGTYAFPGIQLEMTGFGSQ
jgi:hypothetical protein